VYLLQLLSYWAVSSARVTQRYTHVSNGEAMTAMGRLGALLEISGCFVLADRTLTETLSKEMDVRGF